MIAETSYHNQSMDFALLFLSFSFI